MAENKMVSFGSPDCWKGRSKKNRPESAHTDKIVQQAQAGLPALLRVELDAERIAVAHG